MQTSEVCCGANSRSETSSWRWSWSASKPAAVRFSCYWSSPLLKSQIFEGPGGFYAHNLWILFRFAEQKVYSYLLDLQANVSKMSPELQNISEMRLVFHQKPVIVWTDELRHYSASQFYHVAPPPSGLSKHRTPFAHMRICCGTFAVWKKITILKDTMCFGPDPKNVPVVNTSWSQSQ